MQNKFLSLFPLNIVIFPGERINLHIFEPRYKQLIKSCLEEEKTFGIPVYFENRVAEYGTEMQVVSVYDEQEDGQLDIQIEGIRVFCLDEFFKKVEDKLYPGGLVHIIDDIDDKSSTLQNNIAKQVQKLYKALKVKKELNNFKCFDIAHYIGLSTEQEYELLQIPRESDRQIMLLKHLKKIVPIIIETEKLKEKVRMNGHFRNFEEIQF